MICFRSSTIIDSAKYEDISVMLRNQNVFSFSGTILKSLEKEKEGGV